MEKPDLYTTSDHDEAAEVGGTVLWLFAVAIMVAAICSLF